MGEPAEMAAPEAASAATVTGAQAQAATVMGTQVQATTVMAARAQATTVMGTRVQGAEGKVVGSLVAAAA